MESSNDRSWTGIWPKAIVFLIFKIRRSLNEAFDLLGTCVNDFDVIAKGYASGSDNTLRGIPDELVHWFLFDRSVTPGAVKYLHWQRIVNWDPALGSLYYLLSCCVFGPPTRRDRARKDLSARPRALQANKFGQGRLHALLRGRVQLASGIFAIKGCCLNCDVADSAYEWRPFHKTEFFKIKHQAVSCARCGSSKILILGGPRIYRAFEFHSPKLMSLRRCCSNKNCRLYVPRDAGSMNPWSTCPRKNCKGHFELSTKDSRLFYWSRG